MLEDIFIGVVDKNALYKKNKVGQIFNRKRQRIKN